MQYNYITSAGLDSGLLVSTIVIFFCLVLTNQVAPQWWGNIAIYETMDFTDTGVRKTINATLGEYFGPAPGTFH
jgi:hypothetical protein